MQTTKVADPLAGLPGGEAEVEAQRSAEICDGSRVLEVAQFLLGDLVELQHLEEPRRRSRLLLALGGAVLLVLGIGLQLSWHQGLGLLVFVGGIGSLVLGWSLRARATAAIRFGAEPLVRWRGGRFELRVPSGAEGELVSARGALTLAYRGLEGVPFPHDGRAWLRLGSIEVRLAWVRPARRLPRAQTLRRPRWGVAAALGISFLVHQVALALVLAVPPASTGLSSETLDWITRRLPLDDEQPKVRGPVQRAAIRSLDLALSRFSIGPMGGDIPGPQESVLQACVGQAPVAEVHLGHLTASGPRKPETFRRVITRRLRALEACYQPALAACSKAGRIVLTLIVAESGGTFAFVGRPGFIPSQSRDRFQHCVRSVANEWRFARIADPVSTQVRVPLIFRFAGADPYTSGVSNQTD